MASEHLFKTEGTLGRGSFGEILKVVSKEDGRTYALKIIQLRAGIITFEAVQREVDFMRLIVHPNIVQFVNALKTEENENTLKFGIQMEYCEKGDLDTLIINRNERKFNSQEIHQWMLQLSSAIGYIHSNSIMHRDLKPSNILLDGNSNIKVGDFGAARDVLFSLAGTKIGTTIFMAPETFSGNYYLEADIYSLGCVFVCLIAVSRMPKNSKGDFIPLPFSVTYGKTKMDVIRNCIKADKDERPSAAAIYEILKNDDYEMLCFSDVRSPNTMTSVNKMVMGRTEGQGDGAFLFSNRCLAPEEKFTLLFQKVLNSRRCLVIFGFTATDPLVLDKEEVPGSVRELKIRSQSYFEKIEVSLRQDQFFTFWYQEDGAVMCSCDGKTTRADLDVPVSTRLWALFNLHEDLLQVQLTDPR